MVENELTYLREYVTEEIWIMDIYYRTSIVTKDKRTTIRNETIEDFGFLWTGWKVSSERHPVTMHPERITGYRSLSVKIVTRARPFAANEKIISFHRASTELYGSRFNFVDLLVISIRPQNTRQHPFPISSPPTHPFHPPPLYLSVVHPLTAIVPPFIPLHWIFLRTRARSTS